MTYNARLKELVPGTEAELIATRIEFNYTPNGLTSPESLTATWWAQYYIPLGEGYQRIGDDGDRMSTVLADHATTTLEVNDPVTGQVVSLSAMGAVKWLMKFFDYQYNLENPQEELPNEEFPSDPVDPSDSDGV